MSTSRITSRIENAGLVAAATGLVNAAFSYFNYYSKLACQDISVGGNTSDFAQSIYHIVEERGAIHLAMLKTELMNNIPYHLQSKLTHLFQDRGAIKYITDNSFHITFSHIRSLYEDFARSGLLNVCVKTLNHPVANDPYYQIAASIAVSGLVSYYFLSSPEHEPVHEKNMQVELQNQTSKIDKQKEEIPEKVEAPPKFRLFDRAERMKAVSQMNKFYRNIHDNVPPLESSDPNHLNKK